MDSVETALKHLDHGKGRVQKFFTAVMFVETACCLLIQENYKNFVYLRGRALGQLHILILLPSHLQVILEQVCHYT